MNMRVLIGDESRYGNTRVVASNIADGLRAGDYVFGVPVAEATRQLPAWTDLASCHAHRGLLPIRRDLR